MEKLPRQRLRRMLTAHRFWARIVVCRGRTNGKAASRTSLHFGHAVIRRKCGPWRQCCSLSPSAFWAARFIIRSEEHTSELQSLMRNSYAVFCLKKKKELERDHR